MSTGWDLVGAALRYKGLPYGVGSLRLNVLSPYTDCSGLVVKALEVVGINPGGTNSESLQIWCDHFPTIDGKGLAISLNQAYATPGALLFVWGQGATGHVAISMGRGMTVETPVYPGHCVGTRGATGRGWTGAALVPGINYAGSPPPAPAPPSGWLGQIASFIAWLKVAILRRNIQFGDNNKAVMVVQLLLKSKGFYSGNVDGAFGPQTKEAVQSFQTMNGLVSDGVVGPQTFGALTK